MIFARALMLCLALLALPDLALAQDKSAQEKWTTYRNDRYGTAIEYPSRFRPGRPPDNNDGLSFTAADGGSLAVWASFNALDHDVAGLESFLREDPKKGEQITYRAAGKNWLVLSGTHEDRIFYQRHLFSHRGEVVNAFKITYPAALAASYNPIVARISKSLRPGRGYQTKGAP